MGSDDSSGRDRKAGGKRRRRWAIILASAGGVAVVLLLAAAAAVYAERRLIAATFVQRYLEAYGIESEIEFDRLAWGGFLARVRAGSVDAPDFTAEAVDVTLIYPDTSSFAASVTPQVAAVRLIRPVVRITYDGEKLSFGSLQRLVDDILAMDSDVPGPEIAIDDGRLLLSTPFGAVPLLADVAIDKSKLVRLQATIERGVLKDETFAADITGGTVTAAMNGDALNARASLSLASLSYAGRTARGVELESDIGGLAWRDDAGGYAFSLDNVVMNLATGAAEAPEFSAGRSTARVDMQAVAGSWADERLRLNGRGDVRAELGEVRAAGAAASVLNAAASLSAVSVDASSGKWSATTTARVVIDGSDARYPMSGSAVALASLHSEFDSSAMLSMEGASGTFKGTLAGNGSLPEQIALRSLRADFDGTMAADGNHRLRLSSLTATTGMPRARALSLARGMPGIGSDDALANAIASAFQTSTVRVRNVDVATTAGGITVTARAPVVLDGAAQANLTLSPRGATPLVRTAGAQTTGGFNLNVGGGGLPLLRLGVASYRYRTDQNRTLLDADAEFATALSYGSFRGVDLSGSGKLQMAGDRVRFDVPQCADLAMASYNAGGAELVRNLKGRFCGMSLQMSGDRMQLDLATCADVNFDAFVNGGTDQVRDARGRLCAVPNRPVLVSQPTGWQLEARVTDAVARLVAGDARVSDGAARMQLSGDAVAIRSGTITLDRANLVDLQPMPRFQPISAGGALQVMGDNWTGDLTLSLRERRLASVALEHALNSGVGEAAITVRGLAFEPNMLQPADIAPFLSAFGTRIRGAVDFAGRFSWSKDGMASEGRLVVPGVDLQSPFGAARQLKTELVFTSLLPVALRPNQSVTVERVDLPVPLEQVSATFSYTPESFRLETATAGAAQGRAALDPITYSFAPDATSAGTLRLQNINVQTLVAAAGLADRMSVQARIDGTVPFTIGPDGVRFVDGRVAANAPGRLSIKREALTASVGTTEGQAPPNAVQDFAYQALEYLAFERLEGVVNSRPMGRLGLLLHLVGANDPPQAAEARVGIVELLRGRAFDRPLPLPKGTPIDLTLDTSINLDELLESYLDRGPVAAAPATAGQ